MGREAVCTCDWAGEVTEEPDLSPIFGIKRDLMDLGLHTSLMVTKSAIWK